MFQARIWRKLGSNLSAAANLPASPIGEATHRRKELYEVLHPETRHGGNAGGPSGKFRHTDETTFTAATASATGKAERTIRQAAARGEALGDDLKAIAGTS